MKVLDIILFIMVLVLGVVTLVSPEPISKYVFGCTWFTLLIHILGTIICD